MYRPINRSSSTTKKIDALFDRLFILVPGIMTVAMGLVLFHG